MNNEDINTNTSNDKQNNISKLLKNKKILIIAILSVIVVLAGTFGILYATKVICFHGNWSEATCTSPQTCERCGKTKGEPLGHEWIEADCENPKTCRACGETEGEPLGHEWIDADCENPKTCKNCGKTEGVSLGHDWSEADCMTAAKCKRCNKTQNTFGSHTTDNGKCDVCGEYFLENVFIPATLDFAAYGTYGEETGSSLTNCVKS